ncbi:MAG: DUF465 domain-containing protein [Alphaproteobacteria bacterium]
MSLTIRRLERLENQHKDLDRKCTDAEKKLTRPIGELRELKKQKLIVKDQIKNLKAELNDGTSV